MSTTESGRTVHSATGHQYLIRKKHGLWASLRFAHRPCFQKHRSKWYYYWGQVKLPNISDLKGR
jgi:hypothetical protein